ncbi:hypothetical protein ABHV46_09935 [Asaia sp. BMEF1]|uniref:hypothetical protein n=1 Tax=Asaia sp. BMEF1 TaxID=3155932 RepID=UPI003F67B700
MILYEGDEIVLHHHKGSSPYTVITFTGLNFENAAKDFFMLKNVARIKDIDVIGFATKKPNWFLSDDMQAAIKVMNATIGFGRDRLVFGQSMGGYAAIKFSKKLSADYVMALSPKISIHPDECDIDETYHQYLTDKMTGMSVKMGDVRGKIFVLSDPYDKTDSYHTKMLCDISPDIIHVPTFHAGHVVYESMAGSKSISSIIDALASGQSARVQREVCVQRRRNPANLRNRLLRAKPRHMKLVARALASDQIDSMKNRIFIFSHVGFVLDIIYSVALSGEPELAGRIKRKLITNLAISGPEDIQTEALTANNITGPLCLDCHQRIVCYDIRNKCLAVEPLTSHGPTMIPIYPDQLGHESDQKACVTLLGEEYWLVQQDGKIGLSADKETREKTVFFLNKGAYYLISNGSELATSLHGGSIVFSTAIENAWERYIVL